jgi:hypothetical protein
MFSLENKINTEQRFANLVYKDFQTKRFGLTPCCDVEIDEIKLKKYLCDYQEQKAHDDNLTPTENLDRTVLDCDDLPVQPIPTPPDDIPVIDPVLCRSLDFDGIDEWAEFTSASPTFYDFIDYNKGHSFSFWFQYKQPAPPQPGVPQELPFFSKYSRPTGIGFRTGFIPSNNYLYYGLTGTGGFTNSLFTFTPYNFIVGGWYNITWTSDGLDAFTTKTYINGVLIASFVYQNSLSSTIHTLSTPYQIAAIEDPLDKRQWWGEFIGHSIRGWSTILTPAEVLAEYNLGVRLPTPVQAASLELDIQMYNSTWNSLTSNYEIPESVKSVIFETNNMEQVDLLNICPE